MLVLLRSIEDEMNNSTRCGAANVVIDNICNSLRECTKRNSLMGVRAWLDDASNYLPNLCDDQQSKLKFVCCVYR